MRKWAVLLIPATVAVLVVALAAVASVSAQANTPGVPTSVAVTAAQEAATITWDVPASDGGSAITGYQARVGTQAPVDIAATLRTYTFPGLPPGQAVNLQVRAQNANGFGPWSAAESATPTYPPLAQVRNVHVMELSDTSIRISWDPAPNTAGYTVQWREDAQNFDAVRQATVTVSNASDSAVHEVTGLPEGVDDDDTIYYARVRAQTPYAYAHPAGAWSEVASTRGFSSGRELLANTPGGDWLTQLIISAAAGVVGFAILLKAAAGAAKAITVAVVGMVLMTFFLPAIGFGTYWLGFTLVICIVLGGAGWAFLSRR